MERAKLKLYANDYDFENQDFSDVNFRDPQIKASYIRNTKFRRATFGNGKYKGARFENCDLTFAEFFNSIFDDAVFDQTDFSNVMLGDVVFRGCVFRDVKFVNIDLSSCTFINCYFVKCEFINARGAKVRTFIDDGNFVYIQRTAMPYIPMACPDEGAFFGYKKVRVISGGAVFAGIAKLYIPEEAARSSGTGRKCRCQFARVISITGATPSTKNEEIENAVSFFDPSFHYRVGRMVYPDAWDDDRWNECSNGIHFFMNKQEAIDY